MTARRKEHGFTLLELLVSVTILSLLLVVLTNGVRFAGQAWDIQQRQTQREGDLDAVQNVLRQLIASGKSFQGNSESLRFVAALPAALKRGGLYDIELSTHAGDLILVWSPHFKGRSLKPRTETVLVSHVASFALSYYESARAWRSAVDANAGAPVLVRIALAAADGRVWPPFVVAPAIEVQPTATN